MIWRIALVDDEVVQLELLQKMLRTYGEINNLTFQFLTFTSAEAFLFRFEEDKAIDLLILDIEMGEMNGMELAKQLREQNHNIGLLFVTGYTEYMAQGYEVSAVDYVLKPVKREKLFQVLDRFKENAPQEQTYLFVETADGMYRLNQEDIVYLEASKHNTLIITDEEKLEAAEKFGYFEETLSSAGFIKTHRSYLINIANIKKITKQDVVMDNGESVPISRRKYKEVNRAFIDHFKRS